MRNVDAMKDLLQVSVFKWLADLPRLNSTDSIPP